MSNIKTKKTKKKKDRPGGRKPKAKVSKARLRRFDDVKCSKCNGLCCKYIALELDDPEDKEDIDHLRWFLMHQDVSIYVQDDQWHLCVDVRCKQLDDDNRCKIHDERPSICRDHSPVDCEFDNPEYELELEFRTWDQLEAYFRAKGMLP